MGLDRRKDRELTRTCCHLEPGRGGGRGGHPRRRPSQLGRALRGGVHCRAGSGGAGGYANGEPTPPQHAAVRRD
eukprot:1187167-Prorocentrum_minimum.AAC.2